MKLSGLGCKSFQYEQAFDRNLGWLNAEEQEKLRHACVAIAGLGGTGGFQAQALARLGVGRFKLADPDSFEISNMNRQLGATNDTIGISKAEVIRNMVLSINPDVQIEIFSDKIGGHNIDAFLDNADVVIDGIDFFELESKFFLFKSCRKKDVPVVTVCPVGFGATLVIFSSDGMPYDEYFDLKDGMTAEDKRFSTMFGFSPSLLCLHYMKGDVVNAQTKRASSVAPALMLTGAVTGTEVVKLLTGKFPTQVCPSIFQIDLMTHRISKKFYRYGMKSPWMKIKKRVAKYFYDQKSKG